MSAGIGCSDSVLKFGLHMGFPMMYHTCGASCRLLLKIRPQWSEISKNWLFLQIIGLFPNTSA
jgi:hypothetical protein